MKQFRTLYGTPIPNLIEYIKDYITKKDNVEILIGSSPITDLKNSKNLAYVQKTGWLGYNYSNNLVNSIPSVSFCTETSKKCYVMPKLNQYQDYTISNINPIKPGRDCCESAPFTWYDGYLIQRSTKPLIFSSFTTSLCLASEPSSPSPSTTV